MAIVTLDQYNQQTGGGVDYDTVFQQNQPQQQSDYSGYGVYNADDGSITSAIKTKWDTVFESVMAANAGKEHSEFAAANLKRKAEEAKAERDKLGMTGQVIAGGANILPIAAASAINPYAGAGVATAMYTGDIAAEQAMAGQDVNFKTAALGGAATGLADLATFGLASKARSALPAAAPIAKKIGINLAEDASAAVAGNAFTNMATGRDWDEGMGTAALMGGAAGGTVRGSLYGFSKARQTAVNKFGEKAVNDTSQVSRDTGVTPTESFVNEAYAYNNEAGKMFDDAYNTADPAVRAENIDALVNMGGQGGGRAADLEAMQLAKQHNMEFLDTAFDIDVPSGLSRSDDNTYKLYKELGISDREVRIAGEAPQQAQASRFGRTKAIKEGLTKEAYEQKFQQSFTNGMGQIKGSFQTNETILRDLSRLAKEGDGDIAFSQRINTLASDAAVLRGLMEDFTGTQKKDVGQDIQIVSKRLLNGLMEEGLMGKMVGLDGKAGSFDPIKGIMTIDRLERMGKANMPNVHHGTPNKYRNALLGTGPESAMLDAALIATGAAPLAIARRATATAGDEIGKHISQSRLKRLKNKTSGRLEAAQQSVERRKAQAMAEQDMALVSEMSKKQLNDGEISTGENIPSPFEVDAAAQQQQAAQVQAETAARSAPLEARQPRQLTQEEILEVDSIAQTNPEAAAALAQSMQSSPLPAATPRVAEQAQSAEAEVAMAQQSDMEAQALAQAQAAEAQARSGPVPAATPQGRVPTPEQAPAPIVDPAMSSRSLAAQPEVSPDARRRQNEAQLAAALQEEILARQTAQQAEPVAVPEAAPTPTSPDMAGAPSRSPKTAKEWEAAEAARFKAEEAQAKADAESAKADEAQAKAEQADAQEAAKRSEPVPSREPKQPVKEEPEVAPKPVEEAPKRTSSQELVRRDLQKDKDQYSDMSAKQKDEMLDTDPQRLKELRNAAADLKQTNTLIDNMSSKHKMSEDVVATYLDSMGGVRGVKEAIKNKDLDTTVHKYVDREIKAMELEKTQAVKTKLADIRERAKIAAKPEKVEATPEQITRGIADKHIGVRENLASLGYDKGTIDEALKRAKATDTTTDFDPKIVQNWARTLSKQQLDEAKEAVADATSKAKELSQRASKLSDKVMAETQRSRMEADLRDQIEAHKGVMNKKGVQGPDKARSREQVRKLESELDKVSSEQNKARADKAEADKAAKEAAESLEQRHRDFDKLQKKNMQRMEELQGSAKDLKRLNEQKGEIKEKMLEAGATKEEADGILENMFPYQDKSMNNNAFTRSRDKAVKQVKDRKEAEIEAAKASTKEDVSKMDDAELEAAAKELVELDTKIKDYSDPEVQSLNQLVADELEARGQTGEAAYMRAFTMILDKAERRKKAFPNNKDYWISSDDKKQLQSLMNQKEGGSWMGNLQMQLASRFFGDTELRRKFIRLSEDEIQTRINAGIVDPDIVVKPKKDLKSIARKVNKSQK